MFKKFMLLSAFCISCLLPAVAQKVQLSAEGGVQHSLIQDYTIREEMQGCPPGSGFCGTPSTAEVHYMYSDKPAGYLKGLLLYSLNNRVQLYYNLNLNLVRYQQAVAVKVYNPQQGGSGNTGGTAVVGGQPLGGFFAACYQRDANGDPVLDENGQPVPCEEREFYSPPADDRIGNTSILYLTQELGGRYKVGSRLWLQAGVDVAHRLYSQMYVYEIGYTYTPLEGGEGTDSPWGPPRNGGTYEATYSTKKDTSGKGFQDLLLGLQAGVVYELSDRFALSTAFQRSLSHDSGKGTNLVRLGVQYQLRSW